MKLKIKFRKIFFSNRLGLILFAFSLTFFSTIKTHANPLRFLPVTSLIESSFFIFNSEKLVDQLNDFEFERPNPSIIRIIDKIKRKRRITAAALAFPLPFGIIGLHRIYLGTKPYVPLMYIATIGGAFGILPFVDFWVILFDKEFERFQHNEKIFMWIKQDQ